MLYPELSKPTNLPPIYLALVYNKARKEMSYLESVCESHKFVYFDYRDGCREDGMLKGQNASELGSRNRVNFMFSTNNKVLL
jgi:hypothetical protein